MNLNLIKPVEFLNKAYRKISIAKNEYVDFQKHLSIYLDNINLDESEEHHKQVLRDFLKHTFYSDNEINTSNKIDLAVFLGSSDKSNVGVIIEAKRPNSNEMMRKDDFNKKALHEAVLYYLRERIDKNNYEIKSILITDMYEFFVFDAHEFEMAFYKSKLKTEFNKWSKQANSSTDMFYNDIAKPFIESSDKDITCAYFDIRDYKKELSKESSKKLISLFKFFSKPTLIKEAFANDSNSLNKQFYFELLHIIGLEEVSDGGKKLIRRLKEGKRNNGSLLENTVKNLKTEDILGRFENREDFGENQEEQLFNIALELNITWVNRILFLKLLEAQLLNYHSGGKSHKFLDHTVVREFDDLNELFFGVLAKKIEERDEDIREEFKQLPYLNSSLFEQNNLENSAIRINSLRDRYSLPLYGQTVLKNENGKKISGELPTLEYLFKFLDAYDFSSEGAEDVKEDKKSLINASVLGLIFEKINGYKEGSFFTPGYITMYICRETIRRAVLQKFKEAKGWDCDNIDCLYNKIEDVKEANDIINSLKICDPAVGSGHFLVSALNEIIALKSELGILRYHGSDRKVKDYKIEVQNDELVVTDSNDDIFEYKINDKGRPVDTDNQQAMQKTLFHEKQAIIENCLFGVDINPNSVNICRLRLWIELLKNTYYTEDSNYTQLETLPNIDINIKCGNSLVSRFDLQDKESNISGGQRNTFRKISARYKEQVFIYKATDDKATRQKARKDIDFLKKQFSGLATPSDEIYAKIISLKAKLSEHELSADKSWYYEDWKKKYDEMLMELTELDKKFDEKQKTLYSNAFEWRFEFPEVLDEDGKFIGFDAVIGNPPYIQLQAEGGRLGDLYKDLKYETFARTGDIYALFYEKGLHISKEFGLTSLITSNKWMKAAYGGKLRDFLSESTNPILLIDLGPNVFDSATVDTNILTFTNDNPMNSLEVCTYNKTDLEFEKYIKQTLSLMPVPQKGNSWIIMSDLEQNLNNKIKKNGTQLKEWDIDIYFGVKTGYNQAFIIDGETKDRLIDEDPKNEDIIKPLFKGRDLQRYFAEFKDNWLIFIPWHFPINDDDDIIGASDEAEKEFNKSYSVLYNYFKKYKNNLLKRNKAETGIRYEWYALQRCAATYYDEFPKEKIVWKRVGSILRFSYDNNGTFGLDSTCILTGEKIKYLTAFLNSKLCHYQLIKSAPRTGTGDLLISVQAIEPLYAVKPDSKTEKQITALVDKILKAKKALPEADCSREEAEIDRLVYKLYDLTEEEIRIVEEGVS